MRSNGPLHQVFFASNRTSNMTTNPIKIVDYLKTVFFFFRVTLYPFTSHHTFSNICQDITIDSKQTICNIFKRLLFCQNKSCFSAVFDLFMIECYQGKMWVLLKTFIMVHQEMSLVLCI